MSNILIIIPKIDGSGPVRGAIALANNLVNKNNVYLYTHKHLPNKSQVLIDKKIHVVHFKSIVYFDKIYKLKKFISQKKLLVQSAIALVLT